MIRSTLHREEGVILWTRVQDRRLVSRMSFLLILSYKRRASSRYDVEMCNYLPQACSSITTLNDLIVARYHFIFLACRVSIVHQLNPHSTFERYIHASR